MLMRIIAFDFMFGLVLGLLSLPTNIMKVRLNKGTRLIRTRREPYS